MQTYLPALVMLVWAAIPTQKIWADYVFYTLPDSGARILLEGTVKYNPGGTATLRHPRGSLHFSAMDLKVIEAPSPRDQFGKRYRKARRLKTVDAYLDVAKWSLRHGLLDDCKSLLSEAWSIDPTHERLRKLAGLMVYINKPVAQSSSAEAHLRDTVGGRGMITTRSKHFLLLHDDDSKVDPVTRKTRAEMRLELLEKVYESYFLTFAFRDKFLRPPVEPLLVVLYSNHADFLHLERRLDMPLKQVTGFYSPDKNISVFYDAGSSSQFRALMNLQEQMKAVQTYARVNRAPNAGETIRMAKSIDLLVDIQRESEDVATVSHECLHHLAACTDLFPREKAFIRWVHEGLASFFEASKLARWSGVGNVDENRIIYYRLLERDPLRGSIEFIVSDYGFFVESALGDPNAAYGQAWALTHFLFNEHFDKLMEYYDKVVEMPDFDLTGSDWETQYNNRSTKLLEIFIEVFGDTADLDQEWRRYMRRLRTDMEISIRDQ